MGALGAKLLQTVVCCYVVWPLLVSALKSNSRHIATLGTYFLPFPDTAASTVCLSVMRVPVYQDQAQADVLVILRSGTEWE